jgi:hypothetical protein
MPTAPNLTRDIGQAEHALRALLDQLLDAAHLSFSEWTVLVFLNGAGPLSSDALVRRQVNGRVAPETEARASVHRLLTRGLLAPANGPRGSSEADGGDKNPRLILTAAGEASFFPIRRTVDDIVDGLYGDLPPTDLDATHRTLAEITRRANALLDAGS